ncbi:MAG: response regulator [Actinomycetota bacterium]
MKALIVDDNPDIRLLLERVLAIAGLESVQATGGREALEVLAAERPSIVVLDVQMPVMDGWETLRAIRAMPHTKDLPVILCTVKGSADDTALGLQLGCNVYVTKPFDVRELIATVQAVVASGEHVP